MTETELVHKWEALNSQLKNFIFSKVKEWNDTVDILQEVFIKVHHHMHDLKDEDKIIPWIFTITRNQINQFFRDKGKVVLNWEIEDAVEEYNHHFTSCLMGFVDQLSESDRLVLTWTHLDGKSQTSLAEHLGISYSGAKSRVQRAREKLKEHFLDCCDIEHDKYGNILGYKKGSPSDCKCQNKAV